MSQRAAAQLAIGETLAPNRQNIKQPLTELVSFLPIMPGSPYFKTVQNAFKTLISPIYGDQKLALDKIKSGNDRICEVMLSFNNPLGVIVYKNRLQDEYGLKRALELKTLFLFNPQRNSGNGFGSCLFKRVDVVAQKMGADIIYCTASSKVDNSIKCALKNGYEIIRIIEKTDKHVLYLLAKNAN